ncbi:MAG: repeat protein [Peptococcaceae bacterium]|nr:repeat protein [Peptococcaceae bacterium]
MKKRLLIFCLVLCLIAGGMACGPQKAYADDDKDWVKNWKKSFRLPPGIAKKIEHNLGNFWEIRYLTRAQVAHLLAEGYNDYDKFRRTNDVLENVADRWAIPQQYRKAVAFVIEEELMSFEKLPHGKILFEPNKPVTGLELYTILKNRIDDNDLEDEVVQFAGTVRFVYSIGVNTWVVIETGGVLRTAYFTPDKKPANLSTGDYLSVKLDGFRIVEYSQNSATNPNINLSSLTLSIKLDPQNPRVGQVTTLRPQLTNSSASDISIRNVLYRFTLKRAGGSEEWQFVASAAQDLLIPANNESNPVTLVLPASNWVPPVAGDYYLTKAQLKINNGNWQDIRYQQREVTRNLLTLNQSNVETNTTGFSPYGFNTYAGAVLTRDTIEKWQGNASLKVITNTYNNWQGVNIPYQGSQISGTFTFSFYIKAPQGTPLRVVVYDNDRNTYPSGGSLTFTASGDWERRSVTFNLPQRTGNLSLQVTLNNYAANTAFYIDGLQLEERAAASQWIPGGNTSSAAIVVVP